MRVVLTREAGHNSEFAAWVPEDASLEEVPLTETRFFEGDKFLESLRADDLYGEYRALVVTSARSALYVGLAREALHEGGTVLSVGTATAAALEDEDVEVDVVGSSGAAELAPTIHEGPVLLLGAAQMRDELSNALRARGITVTTLACYETVPATLGAEDKRLLREADVVFIGAPSAWRVAKEFVTDAAWVVVPGVTTATEVKFAHDRVLEGWGPTLREQLNAL